MKRAAYTGGLAFEAGTRAQPLRVVGPDEAFIQKKITDYLDLRNIVYAVTDAALVETEGGRRQLVRPAGWPDITALLPFTGRLWGIEAKSAKGKQREAQSDMQALIEASGGLYTVARDCLVVREILNSHLASYTAEEVSGYTRLYTNLKRIYDEHAAARKVQRQRARLGRRVR